MYPKNRYQEVYDDNGNPHRLDGPAFIGEDGTEAWFVNGLRHRLDGPARKSPNGKQEWWVNGKLHRLDGPAGIWLDGSEEWWVNNDNITKEVAEWIAENNLLPWREWDIVEKTLFALRFR